MLEDMLRQMRRGKGKGMQAAGLRVIEDKLVAKVGRWRRDRWTGRRQIVGGVKKGEFYRKNVVPTRLSMHYITRNLLYII